MPANKLSLQIADNPIRNGAAKLIYNKAKNGEISIFDMTGKRMDSFKLEKENGIHEVKINYPAGTYLIQLKSDTGMVIQKMNIL